MAIVEPCTDDQRIQRDVRAEMDAQPNVASTKIEVTVPDGIVTLMGVAANLQQRWIAERQALSVRNVRAVANELLVAAPSDQVSTDSETVPCACRRGWTI